MAEKKVLDPSNLWAMKQFSRVYSRHKANSVYEDEARALANNDFSNVASNLFVQMAVFASAKTIYALGLSSVTVFGGENLTLAQKRQRRYTVLQSFHARHDWLRQQPWFVDQPRY